MEKVVEVEKVDIMSKAALKNATLEMREKNSATFLLTTYIVDMLQ